MQQVPAQMEGSKALIFVLQQGWNWKPSTSPNIELETCPVCKKSNWGHCYMEIQGASSELKQRDGLWMCQRCGKSGNIYILKQLLGIANPQISSQKEWANSDKTPDKLPDVDECHAALMADVDALDYFVNFRGFSKEILQKQKIGIKEAHYFKGVGSVKAIVYPYLVNGNPVWVHYRTLPDINDLTKIPKAFSSPIGYDSTLYNGEILKEGLKELIMVEGEPNCIAAMDKGVVNICGVPGANIKKAEWIDTLDKLDLERIYICYDRDKVGNREAQILASRIGIERCWKITLPEFWVTPEEGIERKGKDLNEWFANGGTLEQFEELKANATLFDVDGVSNTNDAIDEFIAELEDKGTASSKYVFPLFAELAQFEEGDVVDFIGVGKVGKTTVGLNFIDYMVENYGENGIVVCLEMTRARLARKWVSHIARIPDNLPKTKEEALSLTQAFKDAIPNVKELAASREGDLLFCYPKYTSDEDIYKLIIDCIRRYGVKWVMVDNLQRLCDTTPHSIGRTEYLSKISKRLSQIAKDYNIQMIRILQPHQVKQGNLVSVRDVDGSSQIEKDCDVMFALHRNPIGQVSQEQLDKGDSVNVEGSFAPEMLVSAQISRYSAGGSKEIYYDGATSSIYPIAVGKMEEKNANSKIGYAAQIKSQNLPITLPDAIKP